MIEVLMIHAHFKAYITYNLRKLFELSLPPLFICLCVSRYATVSSLMYVTNEVLVSVYFPLRQTCLLFCARTSVDDCCSLAACQRCCRCWCWWRVHGWLYTTPGRDVSWHVTISSFVRQARQHAHKRAHMRTKFMQIRIYANDILVAFRTGVRGARECWVR